MRNKQVLKLFCVLKEKVANNLLILLNRKNNLQFHDVVHLESN